MCHPVVFPHDVGQFVGRKGAKACVCHSGAELKLSGHVLMGVALDDNSPSAWIPFIAAMSFLVRFSHCMHYLKHSVASDRGPSQCPGACRDVWLGGAYGLWGSIPAHAYWSPESCFSAI